MSGAAAAEVGEGLPLPSLPLPSARAFVLLGLVTLLSVFGFATPWLGGLALGFDALILVLVLVDGRLAARTPVRLARDLPAIVHQGEPLMLTLLLSNGAKRAVRVRGREVLGPRLVAAPVDLVLTLPPGGTASASMTLRPRRRGAQRLPPLALRVLGPWGLAWHQRALDPGSATRVHPRAHLEGAAGLLLRDAVQRRTGANPVQRRGFSSELYALREYLPGDSPRSIHWKASARQQRPVVREDSWEQHQHTLILVDCGRPMAALDGDYSKLDHTLSAMLALLRAVLAQGDSATLVLFSKELRRLVRVDRRTRDVASVYEAVHEEQADLDEPDYAGVVAWASRSVPRRSLALVCTSVGDLVGAELLGQALAGLARRHQPLLVNLEDPGLVAHARSIPTDVAGAFAKTSAMHLVHANQALATRLRARGIDVVSAPADQLALRVLQRYLDLKARRRG